MPKNKSISNLLLRKVNVAINLVEEKLQVKSKVMIGVLALGFLAALQAENVVVVADSRGVSVEAEISYEDHRQFRDDDVKPVFRVYEHNSNSVYVDVPAQVDGKHSTFRIKKVRGNVPARIENVGEVELLTFREKL